MKTRTEALACALLLFAGAAEAFRVELKPAVRLGVERDSNVFRVQDSPPPGATPLVDDTLLTAGVGARLRFQESLQKIELRGDYERIDYRALNDLDYDRYQLGAAVDLALGRLWQIKLDADRERRQENFAFRDDAENGLITIDRGSAELRLLATPRITGIARADRYQTRASRLRSQDFDLTEDATELGVQYATTGYSSLGVGVRRAEGEYPRRVVVPGDGREKEYEQLSLIARAGYQPSGLSDFTAQLAYTQRSHDDATVRDFSGVTGKFGYVRKVSGISQLRLELYRDLFYVEDINANYVENLGLRGALDYRWSVKLAAEALAEAYSSNYRGSQGINATGPAREDDVLALQLGLRYEPFYRFGIRPEYRHERRQSSIDNASYDYTVIGVELSYDYDAPNTR